MEATLAIDRDEQIEHVLEEEQRRVQAREAAFWSRRDTERRRRTERPVPVLEFCI